MISRTLIWLRWTLARRQAVAFLRGLRRPTKLLGALTPLVLLGFLFHNRESEAVSLLARAPVLILAGSALLMVAIFRGLSHRRLDWADSDHQFLLQGAFTPAELLFDRLLGGYLFATCSAAFLGVLLAPHLRHPGLTAAGLALFQILCTHVTAALTSWTGGMSMASWSRLRLAGRALVAAYACACFGYFFLRQPAHSTEWLSGYGMLIFYPTSTFPSAGAGFLQRGAQSLATWMVTAPAGLLAGMAGGVLLLATVAGSFRVYRMDFATCAPEAESESIQAGRPRVKRAWLPGFLVRTGLFRGAGPALVWKNLVMASRSPRALLLCLVSVLVVTSPWLITLRIDPTDLFVVRGAIPMTLLGAAFLLQRALPFDFRTGLKHAQEFRTWPASPTTIVSATVFVPAFLCVLCQFGALLVLMVAGGLAPGSAGLAEKARFDSPTLLVCLFSFPIAALGVNLVWNAYYLLGAGKSQVDSGPTAFGSLFVLGGTFAVFFPAGWTLNYCQSDLALPVLTAATVAILVQAVVLFGVLAWMVHRFSNLEFGEGVR